MRRRTKGFTLLEVLVATTIMAIAVGTLLGALTSSVQNASKVGEADRMALFAKRTMDQLLLEPALPDGRIIQGPGWRARSEPFEIGQFEIIQRVVVEVQGPKGTFQLEGFRRAPKKVQ